MFMHHIIYISCVPLVIDVTLKTKRKICMATIMFVVLYSTRNDTSTEVAYFFTNYYYILHYLRALSLQKLG
jgi:hypothetical protein